MDDKTSGQDRRRTALARIHMLKKQLGMDETAYRGMLARVSEAHGVAVTSAGDLTEPQRQAVIEEMRRLGGAPARYPGKPHNFASDGMPAMITKIEALLADMKLPWAYADAIAKRQCGIERCAWVRKEPQLRAIITALAVEQRKRQRLAFIESAVLRLGEAALADLVAHAPKAWKRNLPWLDKVAEQLAEQIEALDREAVG